MEESNKYQAAEIILAMDETSKSYILTNGTNDYYNKLRIAHKDILDKKECEYLLFPYTILCVSTLEYSLNYMLSSHCLDKFGPDWYKKHTEAYISINFNKKLLMSPSIVSDGKYLMNEDNHAYKNLLELIALRNKIVHNKEFLKELTFTDIEVVSTEKEFEIEFTEVLKELTNKQCLEFGESLGKFKNFIMIPALNNTFGENEMVIKNPTIS